MNFEDRILYFMGVSSWEFHVASKLQLPLAPSGVSCC